ncbi:MAG: HAD family hydrolase [Cyanobacteria bacterium]|jgi:HAD superfamily hydrolase (TIGR01549 family)|nr:HAD family hydrolase [Cyanobacteriota bacterium]
MVKISTLIFDFDGTLIKNQEKEFDIWYNSLKSENIIVDKLKLKEVLKEVEEQELNKIYYYCGKSKEFWINFNKLVIRKLGIKQDVDRLANILENNFRNRKIKIYPETIKVLKNLKKKYNLIILSNHTDEILDKVKRLQLNTYFSYIFYSQKIGFSKPNKKVFDYVINKLKCNKNEIIYVGDNYFVDIMGALSAGIIPILIDREDKENKNNCIKIKNLNELLDIESIIKV